MDSSESAAILLNEFKGPYGGVPAFDKMNINGIAEALEKGMEQNLKDIDKITFNSETPTFENTIIELEIGRAHV